MTPEEVIKYLEEHGYIADEVKDVAIAALEKQIPKKPVLVKYEDGFEYYYVCPICRRHLGIFRDDYCDRCGQALDWSE